MEHCGGQLEQLISNDGALGSKGPADKAVTLQQCPNVYVIDCQAHVKGHSDYRKKPRCYEHWRRVMNQEELDRYETLWELPCSREPPGRCADAARPRVSACR